MPPVQPLPPSSPRNQRRALMRLRKFYWNNSADVFNEIKNIIFAIAIVTSCTIQAQNWENRNGPF